MLCFLEIPVLKCALLPYHRRSRVGRSCKYGFAVVPLKLYLV